MREHRWAEVEQGLPALQQIYDQDETRRAGWTVFALFAGVGLVVAVSVTLTLVR